MIFGADERRYLYILTTMQSIETDKAVFYFMPNEQTQPKLNVEALKSVKCDC